VLSGGGPAGIAGIAKPSVFLLKCMSRITTIKTARIISIL
jgi:hypothetical protein